MTAERRPRFVITVEPLPDGVGLSHRLARALKNMLRCYGLRCTSVRAEGGAEEMLNDVPEAEEETT